MTHLFSWQSLLKEKSDKFWTCFPDSFSSQEAKEAMRTTTLKLILTNKEELIGEAEVTGTQGESDHVALSLL